MRLLVYLPLLIPVLAAVAARPLAARLEPREATWLLTVAAVALAGCSTVALALLAASAAARVPALASLGHYSGPPPRPRALLVAVAVLIVVLTGACALQAARDLHALLELARAAR